jgi:hypothetical protein
MPHTDRQRSERSDTADTARQKRADLSDGADGAAGRPDDSPGEPSRHSDELGDLGDLTEEERVEWRRQYNIRKREAEWRRREDERIGQRRLAWEMEQLSQQRRIAQAREALKKRVEIQRLEQGQEKLRREYLMQLRDQKIEDRQTEWVARNTEYVLANADKHRKEETEREEMFKMAQAERQEYLKEAPRLRAAAREKQRGLDQKREENARKKEALRLAKEMKKLNEWKAENARKARKEWIREGPVRSVLAAPTPTGPNPLDKKRAGNIAQRETERKERFEEHRQLVLQMPATTFTGTTEQALIGGGMSVFWHAKSTSAQTRYDVYGADEPEDGEIGEEQDRAAAIATPSSAPLSP